MVVEDPCEDFAADLYTSAQAEIVRVPVDADGICTNRLPTGPARLVHVTPQHQGPLGVTLSAERRRQLLEWAAQSSATVLEEESQGEFRYAAVDAPPLMSLDREGRVLHVGCFASTLGPWLTLGYLVVPQWLVPKALAARRLIDDHALWLEEDALAELLDTGAYARHVQRLRKVYHRRRDALIESMQHHFGGNLRLGGSHAGLHLAWRVPEGLGSSSEVATLARRAGLQAAALPGAPVVLLGFAMPAERLIAAGVAQLAGQLETGVQAVSALFGAD